MEKNVVKEEAAQDTNFENIKMALENFRKKDFFELHNLPYPGECSDKQREALTAFLNHNQKKSCPDARVKIYKETHRRLLDRQIRIIHSRAKYKDKPLLGQTGTVIGICGPVTAGSHETITQNGGARRNVTSQSSFRVNIVQSKERVLKVLIKLDSGGRIILSSEEVRDKTLF